MDRALAASWLSLLVQFLRAQVFAEKRRKWSPDVQAFAHGKAASHQIEAEKIARLLGDDVHDDLMAKRLMVVATSLTRPAVGRSLRLLWNGRRTAAMWENTARIDNLRQACFCGARQGTRLTPIRNCGEHARLVAALIRELFALHQAEQRYWASVLRIRSAAAPWNHVHWDASRAMNTASYSLITKL